jgi:hypothetical protein
MVRDYIGILLTIICLCFREHSIYGFSTPAQTTKCSIRWSSSTTLYSAGNDNNSEGGGGFMQGIKNFMTELDNFMDDASARRLGNGAAFYGKRKSNFYGKDDKNKKGNSLIADPTEDYQAPNNGGYFQWMPDENGQLRPVTRLKKQVVERNPQFWDRFYDQDKNQK